MSMTKLTLNADASLICRAKRLAAKRRTSVSTLFSQFIAAMALSENAETPAIGPLTRRAAGLLRMPASSSSGEILATALVEKYGLKR